MLSEQDVIQNVVLPDLPAVHSHPMDSSRVLLGLMTLARRASDAASDDPSLDGVIAPQVLRSLLCALHYRDVGTVRHSRRVAKLAVGLAQFLGWEGRHLKVLEVAALLHDIGKIGVPDNILFKPSGLSPDEADLMALHYNIGVDVLQACRADPQVLEFLSKAHPFCRDQEDSSMTVGEEVPIGARIIAIADAYDSLGNNQVYRAGRTHEEILTAFRENRERPLDPNIVGAFARWCHGSPPPVLSENPELEERTSGPGEVAPEDAHEATGLCHIFSFLYLLESLYDGFYVVDSDLRFTIWNRGAERLLGFQTSEMLNHVWTSRVLTYADQQARPLPDNDCPMHRVVGSGKPSTSLLQMRHADGRWRPVELQTVPLVDRQGRLQGVVEIIRDLSRSGRKPQEYRQLRIAASRDPLTGVANRGEMEAQLTSLASKLQHQEDQEPFSVIFSDVDHFKSINDKFGHGVGDKVLVEVARLLQQDLYSAELVARYGGEEFVVVCPATDLATAFTKAERLRNAIAKTKIPELKSRQLTSSFGVAQYEPGDTPDSVVRRADKALYMAKEGGRNQTKSLTTAQLLQSNKPAEEAQLQGNSRLYHGTFHAVIASDMIVYKLGGFVHDKKAAVLEVAPKKAKFRIGQSGLFGFWGSDDASQPVEVELCFGDSSRGDPRATNRVEVIVHIRPVGWVRKIEAFQSRATRVFKDLRAYFAASDK